MSGRCMGLFVAVLAAAGCRSLDFVEIPAAKDWNLRQLHDADGGHVRRAAVMGDTQYFLRFGLGSFLGNSRERLQDPNAKRVRHVPNVVLENVLALAEFSSADPEITTLQAEWFSWLAVDDPWPLVRERCVLELGELSGRLGLAALPGVPKPEEVSTPAAVESALARLLAAAKSAILERRRPTAAEHEELAAAAAGVRGLVLDIDGGRRALRVVKELLRAGDVSEEFRGPLRDLSREVTRDLAGQAMARAVRDEDERVRAAALESVVRATGTKVVGELLAQMRQETSPLVVARLLRLVRLNGLPPDASAAERERQLAAIVEAAVEHPDGSVRANAALCLGAVTDAGLRSLREEDWLAWWRGRSALAPATTETDAADV